MCDEERPEDYQVPEGHEPVGDEAMRIQNEKLATFIFQEVSRHHREFPQKNKSQGATLKGQEWSHFRKSQTQYLK